MATGDKMFFKNFSKELQKKYGDTEDSKVIDMTTLKEVKKKPKRKTPKYYNSKRNSMNKNSTQKRASTTSNKADSGKKRISISKKDVVTVETESESCSTCNGSDSYDSESSVSSRSSHENYQRKSKSTRDNFKKNDKRSSKSKAKKSPFERKKNRENVCSDSDDDDDEALLEKIRSEKQKLERKKYSENSPMVPYSYPYPPPPPAYPYPSGSPYHSHTSQPQHPPHPYYPHYGYPYYPPYYPPAQYPPRAALQNHPTNYEQQIVSYHPNASHQALNYSQMNVQQTLTNRSAWNSGEHSNSGHVQNTSSMIEYPSSSSNNNPSFDELKENAFKDLDFQKKMLKKNIIESTENNETSQTLWSFLSTTLSPNVFLPPKYQVHIFYDHVQVPYINISIPDPEFSLFNNRIDKEILQLSEILYTTLKRIFSKPLLSIEN